MTPKRGGEMVLFFNLLVLDFRNRFPSQLYRSNRKRSVIFNRYFENDGGEFRL